MIYKNMYFFYIYIYIYVYTHCLWVNPCFDIFTIFAMQMPPQPAVEGAFPDQMVFCGTWRKRWSRVMT